MAISESVDKVGVLLEKVRIFNRVVEDNELEPDTVADMKGNAKNFCDQAKTEINNIKNEINAWE